jgi:hypothetical protein
MVDLASCFVCCNVFCMISCGRNAGEGDNLSYSFLLGSAVLYCTSVFPSEHGLLEPS